MDILIVDDQEQARLTLETVLSEFGNCRTAESGEKAVELFTEKLESGKGYDLVIMDIMMPDMDGHEALKEMRIREKEYLKDKSDRVVAIMLSALDDDTTILRAEIVTGADKYISKPIDADSLIASLRDLKLID